jgi:hypothetical protein
LASYCHVCPCPICFDCVRSLGQYWTYLIRYIKMAYLFLSP